MNFLLPFVFVLVVLYIPNHKVNILIMKNGYVQNYMSQWHFTFMLQIFPPFASEFPVSLIVVAFVMSIP